jgi:hypothetical protein
MSCCCVIQDRRRNDAVLGSLGYFRISLTFGQKPNPTPTSHREASKGRVREATLAAGGRKPSFQVSLFPDYWAGSSMNAGQRILGG